MTKKQALGRGFDSLIPVDIKLDSVVSPGERIENIQITKLVANPDQPRREFDEKSLQELAVSIKQHGIIQPIVVTPLGNDKYKIVAGERRFRASQIIKLKQVPSIIRNHKELEELEIALVENVQRVDLSPFEQAMSIIKLRDQFNMPIKSIAKKLGKAETTLSNTLRLLKLPKKAVKMLQNKSISEGHARAILALKTEVEQLQLLNKIIVQKLSVREAESLVKLTKKSSKADKKELSIDVKKLQLKASKAFKNVLQIHETRKGHGKITISYSSIEELESYLKKLDSNYDK